MPVQGITMDTLETVNEVLLRVVPANVAGRLAYLSGPSFAAEVAEGLPAAVTVAAGVSSICGGSVGLVDLVRINTKDMSSHLLGEILLCTGVVVFVSTHHHTHLHQHIYHKCNNQESIHVGQRLLQL